MKREARVEMLCTLIEGQKILVRIAERDLQREKALLRSWEDEFGRLVEEELQLTIGEDV